MHIALLPPVSPPSHTELAKCGDGYCHNGEQCSAEGICVCCHTRNRITIIPCNIHLASVTFGAVTGKQDLN